MASTKKPLSPIVEAVMALDDTFEEMKRLAKRIDNLEIRGDSDYEHLRDFMTRYAQSAECIATHVHTFSQALNDARASAEESAQAVAKQAEYLQNLHNERQKNMKAFETLRQKVNDLTHSLKDLKPTNTVEHTEADRSHIYERLMEMSTQLDPLIQEAQQLREQAENAKMTSLAQETNALRQSLVQVSHRLNVH